MNLTAYMDELRTETPAWTGDSLKSSVTLWFLAGPLRQQEALRHVPVVTQPFVVGRRTDVAFSIPHETVSSIHAELIPDGESLWVQDLGSTNGTYINAKRITTRVKLEPGDLIQFADVPYRVMQQSALTNSTTVSHDVIVDQALALVHFEQLMQNQAVVPHYQPIIDLATLEVIGYEVLGRSHMPGLETPAAMFSAAAHLNLEVSLSQMLRSKGIEATQRDPRRPHLFVNTHPRELKMPGLIESIEAIRLVNPHQPLTLEIHEGAVADTSGMKSLRNSLADLDVRLAFDDFGAGQTRLIELSAVHPDYVKFDMSLIRSIDCASAEHLKMVKTLVAMLRDIGIAPLAEGVEHASEAETCLQLGFQLAQGYHFGRPAPWLLDARG